ncbi:MAG: TraR/DksA C4-type zinc finger protein [Myxococcales bacterium]|nr:TraR/DksA C4-type zinc finger protein [Myxococcales bacterium]
MADLDAAAVAVFAETLRELREELRALLRSSADGAKPVGLDQAAVGRLSRVDALQQQAMAQANRQQVQVRLRRCEAALEAIQRDEYGLCRRCEEPIAIARLEAMPEAPFCVECQQGRS